MANVWDVYTVGDVSFIHEVFLGVSHIFYGTGHNVFLQVYMIGMLLGFIWIFIESMIQQKPIALGRFLVAFIIYSALFVPRATVHLEDSQTKKFYTMDNIPLGLAVGSSLVSKVGAGLTHVFEDYFTPVGGAGSGCSPTKTTCAGYLGSLSKIVQIRENLASQPAFLALDRAICGEDYKTPPLPSAPQVKCSIQKSISNYVRHCGVNRFIQNPQLLKSVRNFNDFRYNNFSYNTDLYLWPDKPRTRNCYEAFIDIDTALTKYQSVIEDLSVKPQWLSGLSHDTTGGGDETAQMVTGAGVNHNQIAEILSQMSGASGTTPDVYTYIKNVMLRGPIEDGLMAGYSDVGDARAALMIKSARDQRNIQWAAEENMWISTAKAMATFFEGFVVALVVLIPFVMFMGGLNIMIEYLKVLMWVQLWNPVMAICNLYIQTAASQKVRDAIASSPITDMYVMDSVDEVVQHWIAVGGLMAATTPLLALFILKGSVYTFTTLASRMSGGDHVNEKAVSPDVMQHAPMLQNTMGALNADLLKGVRQVGGDSAYKTISSGQVMAGMTASAEQNVSSASNAFNHAVGEAWQYINTTGNSESFSDSFMGNLQKTNAEAYNKLYNTAKNLLSSHGISANESTVKSVASKLGVSMGATAHLGASNAIAGILGELGINFGKDWTTTDSENFSDGWEKAVSELKGSAGSYSDTNSMASSIAKSQNHAIQHVKSTMGSSSQLDNVQNQFSTLQSAQSSYTRTSQKTNSLSTVQSMDSGQWARQYSNAAKFTGFMNTLSWEQRNMMGLYNESDGKTGTELDKVRARALEWAVSDQGKNSEIGKKFWETFGNDIPFNPYDNNAESNSGLSANKPHDVKGNAREQVQRLGENTNEAINQGTVNLNSFGKDVSGTNDRELGNGRNLLPGHNAQIKKDEEARRKQAGQDVLKHVSDKNDRAYVDGGAKTKTNAKAAEAFGRFFDANFVGGDSNINRYLAEYMKKYIFSNTDAWVQSEDLSQNRNGTGWEKPEVYFERNDVAELREMAIDELRKNNGLSYDEAAELVKNSPKLMQGIVRDYVGMRGCFADENIYTVRKDLSKGTADQMVDGNAPVNEAYYQYWAAHNPDNWAFKDARRLFNDQGKDFHLGDKPYDKHAINLKH